MKNITIPTNFFHDERIVAIAGEFGACGQLATLQLLCEIYANGYFIEWNTLKQNYYARTMGVNPDELRAIVNRLAEYGVFSREMLEKECVLTSEDAQRRYFRPKTRRRDISNIPYLIITLQQAEPDCSKESVEVEISSTEMKSENNDESPAKSATLYGQSDLSGKETIVTVSEPPIVSTPPVAKEKKMGKTKPNALNTPAKANSYIRLGNKNIKISRAGSRR